MARLRFQVCRLTGTCVPGEFGAGISKYISVVTNTFAYYSAGPQSCCSPGAFGATSGFQRLHSFTILQEKTMEYCKPAEELQGLDAYDRMLVSDMDYNHPFYSETQPSTEGHRAEEREPTASQPES
jgi:hypothetical protein